MRSADNITPKKAMTSAHVGGIGSAKATGRKGYTYVRGQSGFNCITVAKFNGKLKIIVLGGMPNAWALFERELETLKKIMDKDHKAILAFVANRSFSKEQSKALKSIIDEYPDKILDPRSLGQEEHANQLNSLKVSGFVDLRTEDEKDPKTGWPRDSRFDEIESHEIPISDNDSFDGRFEDVCAALEFIDNHDINYVHCRAGVGRSYSMVLAWLMTRLNLSLKDAEALIKVNRPQVVPSAVQTLKVCEYVFWDQKKKFLELMTAKPSAEQAIQNTNTDDLLQKKSYSTKRLINTFDDLCSASHKKYEYVLRKGGHNNLGKTNIKEIKTLPADLEVLIQGAQFILEQLRNDNSFDPEDAEKFHNNLLTIFRMLAGISVAYSEFISNNDTIRTKITSLKSELQESIKGKKLVEMGEAQFVCTELIDAAKKSLNELDHSLEGDTISSWLSSLQKQLTTLESLKKDPNIDLIAVKKIQEEMLDALSLEPNILLISRPNGQNEDQLKTIIDEHKNENKPILIRHGERATLYGCISKTWKFTELNPLIFTEIPHPKEDKLTPGELKSYEMPDRMRDEIKKGHNPEYPGFLIECCRLIKEVLKIIFNFYQEKNEKNTNCMIRIKYSGRKSVSKVCENINGFFKQSKETHSSRKMKEAEALTGTDTEGANSSASETSGPETAPGYSGK